MCDRIPYWQCRRVGQWILKVPAGNDSAKLISPFRISLSICKRKALRMIFSRAMKTQKPFDGLLFNAFWPQGHLDYADLWKGNTVPQLPPKSWHKITKQQLEDILLYAPGKDEYRMPLSHFVDLLYGEVDMSTATSQQWLLYDRRNEAAEMKKQITGLMHELCQTFSGSDLVRVSLDCRASPTVALSFGRVLLSAGRLGAESFLCLLVAFLTCFICSKSFTQIRILSQLAGPHQCKTHAPACGWSIGPTAKIREKQKKIIQRLTPFWGSNFGPQNGNPERKKWKPDPILGSKIWTPKLGQPPGSVCPLSFHPSFGLLSIFLEPPLSFRASLLWFLCEPPLVFLWIFFGLPVYLLWTSFESSLHPPFFEFLVRPCFQSPLGTSCHAVLKLFDTLLYFTSLTYNLNLLRTFFQNLSASYLTHFEPFDPPLSLMGSKSNETLLISSFAISDTVSLHARHVLWAHVEPPFRCVCANYFKDFEPPGDSGYYNTI